MGLHWIHEQSAHWDAAKAAIIGAAPPGVFDFRRYREGDLLPGDWWRVEEDGQAVGYGWMDTTFGDVEILLAVAPASEQRGVGSFILDHLEKEAHERGYNYLFNVIPERHPAPERLRAWLEKRRFAASEDGKLLRCVTRR